MELSVARSWKIVEVNGRPDNPFTCHRTPPRPGLRVGWIFQPLDDRGSTRGERELWLSAPPSSLPRMNVDQTPGSQDHHSEDSEGPDSAPSDDLSDGDDARDRERQCGMQSWR